jgi:hypothetical protein
LGCAHVSCLPIMMIIVHRVRPAKSRPLAIVQARKSNTISEISLIFLYLLVSDSSPFYTPILGTCPSSETSCHPFPSYTRPFKFPRKRLRSSLEISKVSEPSPLPMNGGTIHVSQRQPFPVDNGHLSGLTGRAVVSQHKSPYVKFLLSLAREAYS